MSNQLLHFFLSSEGVRLDEATADEPKLVWKAVLRTGTWKLRPGPGGVKIKAPLKVLRDKAPKGHISMADLVKSFQDKAKENVTATTVHADGTTADVGHIRKLVIQDLPLEKGAKEKQSLLWAGMEITEPDIAQKIQNKTLVGCSGGILFDYERTLDAKKFDQILSHVMVTNNPWIDGTGGYADKLPEGVMASESADLPIGEMEMESADLDVPAPDPAADPGKKDQPASGSVIWKPEEGYSAVRSRVQKALDDWRRALLTNASIDGYRTDFPYYNVDDIAGEGNDRKALVRCGYGSDADAWVVSVTLASDGVEIEPFMNWTPAKQEWVAASQDQTHSATSSAPRREDPVRPDGSGSKATVSLSGSDVTRMSLSEAREARAERRLGLSRPTNTRGASMGSILDKLAGVDLSDEQREAIRREEEEIERDRAELSTTRERTREGDTNAYLSELATKLGYEPPENETDAALSLDPALARFVRSVLMSDDGGPAIELSEFTESGSRTQAKPTTASSLIKGFIDALPTDDKGKVSLAQQARRMPGDENRPDTQTPPDNGGHNQNQVSSRQDAKSKADAFLAEAEEQGLPVPAHAAGASKGGN